MSTADAVSLFTTSLNSALAQQKQDILSELQPNRQSLSKKVLKNNSILTCLSLEAFSLLSAKGSSRYSLTVSQPWRSAILSILLRWQRVSSTELINALVSSNLQLFRGISQASSQKPIQHTKLIKSRLFLL
jgi:hypothetical protein